MTESSTPRDRLEIQPILDSTRVIYRGAVILSFALLLLGLAIALIADKPLGDELGSPATILRALRDGEPSGVVGVGIGVMLVAPVVMVLNAIARFLQMGDRRYAGYSALVAVIILATLIASLFGLSV